MELLKLLNSEKHSFLNDLITDKRLNEIDMILFNANIGECGPLKIYKKFSVMKYDVPDFATLKKCVGPPFTYSFPNYLHIKDEDFKDAVATYRHYYDKEDGCLNADVFEGVESLLEALVKRGYCLFVCTSKPEPTARKILSHLGIDKYFTEICGATMDAKVDTKADVINLCFMIANDFSFLII